MTGQDGGYLVEQLVAEGCAVHGLVHEQDLTAQEFRDRNLPVTLHTADLSDAPGCTALIEEIAPDEIYHLAGVSSVAFSWEQPVVTGQITGLAVAVLLEAAWQSQEKTGRPVRFVQASSAEIFGNAQVSPQNELTPLRPTSPYGAAKAYGHHLVGVYRGRGLGASACVLYNHESPRRPPQFVTRKITRAAARISAGLERELVLGNLEVRRDWGWAPDYVAAMIRTARHPEAEDFVIATGESHSVGEFVAAAFAAAGVEAWQDLVRTDPEFVRPVDATEQVGDSAKARSVLGWAPTVTFVELVERMVAADLADLPHRSSGNPSSGN
ncbi:GDP-mannose 4,6-dehydratase [Jatrophihabitans sp. DSM 45814]